MESKINYTIVGFFVIVFSISIIIAGFWLTAGRTSKAYITYQVYMNESASGLSEQAPVKFNGVQVGYVSKVELNRKNLQQAYLLLNIDEDVPITTSTVATLHSQGITGVTYVGLKAKTAVAPLLKKPKSGELYPEIKSGPSLLIQIDSTIREVASKVKEVSDSIIQLLDAENLKAVKNSLHNIEQVSNTIAKNSQQIDRSFKNLDKVLANAKIASEELPSAIHQISQAGEQIKKTMTQTRSTLQNLSPPTLELIQRLERTATHLEQLSSELKQNPSMLIRGKQSATPGPGE